MAKTEKVVPSERAKKFRQLETPEDLQKDIQTMYSEAGRLVAKAKDKHPLMPLIKSQHEALKHYVSETKEMRHLTHNHLANFWNLAYSHYDKINDLITQK